MRVLLPAPASRSALPRRRRVAFALAAVLLACRGPAALARTRCDPQPPCAAAVAVVVRVVAQATRGLPAEAFVSLRAPDGVTVIRTERCAPRAGESVCRIEGGAGTYDLVVGAPGFAPATARVEVADTSAGGCCTAVGTQEVTVALARTPIDPGSGSGR